MNKINCGDVFGRLTVTGSEYGIRVSGAKKKLWICSCECGAIISVETGNLNTGNTRQCYMCAIESRANYRRKHSFSVAKAGTIESKMYYTWLAMKRRCNNKSDKRYSRYGGRGIGVCSRWDNDFCLFLSDFGLPPSMDHQIDRVDNNKGYDELNCRWATRKQQANNKSNNKIILAFGLSMTQQQWADKTGIKRETIAKRLDRGWTKERAVTK